MNKRRRYKAKARRADIRVIARTTRKPWWRVVLLDKHMPTWAAPIDSRTIKRRLIRAGSDSTTPTHSPTASSV